MGYLPVSSIFLCILVLSPRSSLWPRVGGWREGCYSPLPVCLCQVSTLVVKATPITCLDTCEPSHWILYPCVSVQKYIYMNFIQKAVPFVVAATYMRVVSSQWVCV